MEKLTLRYSKDCVWVSQPDVKRAHFFEEISGTKDVKVVRNFALRNFKYPIEKLTLCEKLRKDGYSICIFTGTMGKNLYIEDILKFIRISEVKIAVIFAGALRDKSIEALLKNEDNNEYLSKLIYLGFLPRKEMHALLSSADFALVLYTSSFVTKMSAGSSAKVGSYIAYGLPVIYPSFWDYEKYYREFGLNYNNGQELVERIRQLAKDQDLRIKLSENAKHLFNDSINFESEFKNMEETIHYYMEVKL